MSKALLDKAAVVSELGEHPAVRALTTASTDWKPEWLTDAKFDRGELTLTVAADSIRAAAFAVQAAGYNFFEDMTAVDWFPSTPRFQLSYHILSHQYKEHIRLRVFVDESDAQVDTIVPVWPSANFYEREVFDLFGIRSISDFIAPRQAGLPDHIGAFAVTTGHGLKNLRQFRAANDDYNAIMAEALADRLAEAFAECLHNASATSGATAAPKPYHRGPHPREISRHPPRPRLSRLPRSHREGHLWRLLDVEANTGIQITESFAMWPGSSVSGLYFAHPDRATSRSAKSVPTRSPTTPPAKA